MKDDEKKLGEKSEKEEDKSPREKLREYTEPLSRKS
jgi:hypothetical protein